MSDGTRASRRRSPRVVTGTFLFALILLAALVPSSALAARPDRAATPAAAGPSLQVDLWLYDPCFQILNAVGPDPLTVIHRRSGTVVGTVTEDADDFVRPCVGTLRPRDTVEIRQSGQQERLLTVPVLKLRVDLTGRRLLGRVPVSVRAATVNGNHEIAGLDVGRETGAASVAPDGTFQWTPTSWTIGPGDIFTIRWASPAFDEFGLTASSPSVTVSTWTQDITVTGVRASRVAIAARHGSTLRAAYARQLPPYEVLTYGKLRRNGSPARPVKGDTVTHTAIDGVALTVLANAMTVDPAGNGSLRTSCFARGEAVVDVDDQHRSAFTVSASGILDLSNLTDGKWDIQSGDVILVGCESRKGGAQLKRYVVP